MSDPEFEAELKAAAARTEAALERLLPRETGPAARLAAAMRYVALGGGKRLRAFLALETARIAGAEPGAAERVAAALECVHAYSLAHDDLPAMDDDAMRRGRPTAHLAFDEATAILAGDALQSVAFEILADPATSADPAVRSDLVALLAQAIGAGGMCGGQMIDILAEERAEAGLAPLDLDGVTELQAMKTGALIRAAALSGARLGGLDRAGTAALAAFADRLGLAFQIRDDLLDHDGDEAAAGKRLRKDAAAGKATFVDLLGLAGARAKAEEIAAAAEADLAPFGAEADGLRRAARFSVARSR